jgi:hypothetical protein
MAGLLTSKARLLHGVTLMRLNHETLNAGLRLKKRAVSAELDRFEDGNAVCYRCIIVNTCMKVMMMIMMIKITT